MKIILTFAVSVILFFAAPFAAGKGNDSTRSVSVAIELEDLPEVLKYELEVKKDTWKKTPPLSFSQQEPQFKIKLDVGNYQVRTRIVSVSGEVGPWSDWSELLARPEEVAEINIPNINFSVRKNQTFTDVGFKWEKPAGAEKYVIWIENLSSGLVVNEAAAKNEAMLKLKPGEYRIGIQSVSKDGIKSKIKYLTDSVFVGKTMLPRIQVKQPVAGTFNWKPESEASVKVDLYRKAFFGDKYERISTVKQSADAWLMAKDSPPGEYRIDFQYISDAFENGPVESVFFLKKPDETNF